MKLRGYVALVMLMCTLHASGYDEYEYCGPYDDYSYAGNPDCAVGIMLFLIQQNIDDLAERLSLQEQDLADLRTSLNLLRSSLEKKMDEQYEQLRTQMKELVQATLHEYCVQHAAELPVATTPATESQLNHPPEQAMPAPVNSIFGGLVSYIFSIFKETEIRNQQLCPK